MTGIDKPSQVPESDLKTCVLIDGQGVIQALGKPHGCYTFGDLADVIMATVTRHFGEHTTRVDVVFDRYIMEDFIKAITRQKCVGKKKPIRKLNDGQHVPLPTMWNQFIALDDNKAALAQFLSEGHRATCTI